MYFPGKKNTDTNNWLGYPLLAPACPLSIVRVFSYQTMNYALSKFSDVNRVNGLAIYLFFCIVIEVFLSELGHVAIYYIHPIA